MGSFLKAFSLITILLTSQVFAMDCPSVDLTSDPQSPIHRMPYANQGAAGICYAFTGTFITDWWRFSHGDKEKPSSILYAAYYSSQDRTHKQQGNLDGGTIDNVVKTFGKMGTCDAETVNEALAKFMISNSRLEADIQFLQFVSIMQVAINQKLIKKSGLNGFLLKGLDLKVTVGNDTCLWAPETFDMEKLIPYLEPFFVSGDILKAFENVLKVCQKKKISPELPALTTIFTPYSNKAPGAINRLRDLLAKIAPPTLTSTEKTMSSIAAALIAKNPQPVAVSYCAQIMTKNYSTLYSAKECHPHGSVVVGSRSVNGRCQLLVHNSFGNDDENELPWETKKNKDGGLLGAWIDADYLINNSYSFQTFQNQ